MSSSEPLRTTHPRCKHLFKNSRNRSSVAAAVATPLLIPALLTPVQVPATILYNILYFTILIQVQVPAQHSVGRLREQAQVDPALRVGCDLRPAGFELHCSTSILYDTYATIRCYYTTILYGTIILDY